VITSFPLSWPMLSALVVTDELIVASGLAPRWAA
jgi:hypothetical protein